jgi:hypothetical protein
MIKYSWPITIAGLAGIINETFDRQFLKFLLPEDIQSSSIRCLWWCCQSCYICYFV